MTNLKVGVRNASLLDILMGNRGGDYMIWRHNYFLLYDMLCSMKMNFHLVYLQLKLVKWRWYLMLGLMNTRRMARRVWRRGGGGVDAIGSNALHLPSGVCW